MAVAPTEPKAIKKRTRNPPTHPTYEEMINDAIVTLKERTGSSLYAISKFIEEKHKDLPAIFKKRLSYQLKKLVHEGKLVKVKASYKLPPARPSASEPAAVKKKPSAAAKPNEKAKAAAKPKEKTTKATAKSTAKPNEKAKAAAKPKEKAKAAAKPKEKTTKATAKSTAKPKPKAAAAEPKAAVAKPKATEKPKAAPLPKRKAPVKAKEERAMVSRTSTRTSAGRISTAATTKAKLEKVPAAKKSPAMAVKSKNVKSPTKKPAAKKGKK